MRRIVPAEKKVYRTSYRSRVITSSTGCSKLKNSDSSSDIKAAFMHRLLTHAVRTVSGAHWTQLLVLLCTHAYTVQTTGNMAVFQIVVYRHFVFSEREHVRYLLSPVRLSVCLSVVCNVRAPYSGGSNFRQYFYGISYLGHPLTSSGNFTEIVPGEPLRRGS